VAPFESRLADLVALLANENTGAQRRGARMLADLSSKNPGSPVIIVNAGAISPLVLLLSAAGPSVQKEASKALANLSLNSTSTQLAIATGLVALLGVGTCNTQECVTSLLLLLVADTQNRMAIAKADAIPRLVLQIRGADRTISVKAQEHVSDGPNHV
jgi:hypothetical protein